MQPTQRWGKPYVQWIHEALTNPDPDWIVEGLLPAKGLTVITGAPKRGKKSWLAYGLALIAASGKQVGALKGTAPHKTLYINKEDIEKKVALRFASLQNGWRIPHEQVESTLMLSHKDDFMVTDEVKMAALVAQVTNEDIKLVVIDTLARSSDVRDENSSAEVGRLVRAVDNIQKAGAAVLLVHHTGKGHDQIMSGWPDNVDDDSRGSSALSGAWDEHLASRHYRIGNDPKTAGPSEHYLILTGKGFEAVGYTYKVNPKVSVTPLYTFPEWPIYGATIELTPVDPDHFSPEEDAY